MKKLIAEGVDSNGRPILRELNSENLYEYYSMMKFRFSRRTLGRYFLSLKTKPFVILTGISGTGKTKIAQLFADYVLQDESPEDRKKMVAFISVRPDWMDNKGLLGFYNILDQKYHSTPLLKLIQHAEKNLGKPHFVILDEMNLAKVEYYFSDFLSIMETRTKDKQTGEPIHLHQNGNVLDVSENTIPERIYLPKNIYFTGTVNVDETTYMFSPKVLDRANVIEFNEVILDKSSTRLANQSTFVLKNQDVRNALNPETNLLCSLEDYEKYQKLVEGKKNAIEELLDLLKPYNLHFGYRVVNEMSRFVCQASEYIQDFSLEDAMDIQILQKILPKFHGTRGKLEDPLKDVHKFCKAEDSEHGALYPRSSAKIARMLKNLEIQGYTSFIE